MRFHAIVSCIAVAMFGAGCAPSVVDAGQGGGGNPSVEALLHCPSEPSCPLSQPCLATVENQGTTQFGLRVAELAVSSPPALANGPVAAFWSALFGPNLPACALPGRGDTSWLLRFDLEQGTLTMGGAAPPAAPSQAYRLLDTAVSQGGFGHDVAPITFALSENAQRALTTRTAQDFALPMFFPGNGATPTGPFVLTFHALRASEIVISPTHDCIGSYDTAVFDPEAGCQPKSLHHYYEHGGRLDGWLSLEETDSIEVAALGETLCVALTGDATTYGDRTTPIARCARTNGVIDFQGDWCSTTNGPKTATCSDAVHFVADFAASAVRID
jgi:hypothetical protein